MELDLSANEFSNTDMNSKCVLRKFKSRFESRQCRESYYNFKYSYFEARADGVRQSVRGSEAALSLLCYRLLR